VEQSRLLRLRLSDLGRIEGVDFEYLEADSGHEEVALAWPKVLRHKVMSFCLARSGYELADHRREVDTGHEPALAEGGGARQMIPDDCYSVRGGEHNGT
jgi:hypothetical protein